MFYRYDLKMLNNKMVLYLYLSTTTEEANEFKNNNNETIEQKVKKFITTNNIEYSGPVYIISNGIIIKSIDIKNKKINMEELLNEDTYSNNNFIVTVKNNNRFYKVTLKEYLMSAIFTNLSYELNEEVLKAIIILYRTYLYKKMGKDGFIEADNLFIKYKKLTYYKLLWFENYNEISKKLEKIIDKTDSIFITYNNLFIEPYIHSVNNGTTDTLEGVEYLEKINSLWDLASPLYISITKFRIDEFSKLLKINIDECSNIKILDITKGGCLKRIKVGNKTFSGDEFKSKLRLPSKDMTILIDDNKITFINRGQGNNLGLSIEGSKKLSEAGCSYLQILNYYFPKCKIKKYV